MLKHFIFGLLTLTLSNFTSVNVQAESLKGLSKDDFIEAYEEKMESAWDAYSLLYARIDPEMKNMVPGKVWTDEDRQASACIYDNMKQRGQLDKYIASVEKIDEMRDTILQNKQMNITNMQDFPEVENDSLAKVDGYIEAMQSCGYMELMQQRMQESGLWSKLMKAAAAG